MGLMNNLKLDFDSIQKTHNIDFIAHFASELDRLKEYANIGVLEINDKGLYTTATGGLLIRNIAMVFDTYLHALPQEKRVFSKTI